MLSNPSIRIGCSGWQYQHWRGDFYPAELPQQQWLEYYAERFDTVEINNTFYRLPEAATFAAWGRRAPRGFLYAVKASRYLTHMKKLKDPGEPIARFFSRASRLRRSFGPVLYQLPPRWPMNLDRFRTFLRVLPRRRRHAVEFREPSWSRCAFTTCPGPHPAGSRSDRSFTSASTAHSGTAGDMRTARWRTGRAGCASSTETGIRCLRISTTTSGATRQEMPRV
jgi:hypothetical protein